MNDILGKIKYLFLIPIVLSIALWVFLYNFERKNLDQTFNFPCVSYAPYDIDQKKEYSEAELIEDLTQIKTISTCVRIYSVLNGLDKVPKIAEGLGMEVIVGAWLDQDEELNEEGIEKLIALSKSANNIKYLIVGNETLLMKRIPEDYLLEKLDLVREVALQPVTTTETQNMWAKHPELEEHVDFLGLHKFPYWEGVQSSKAVASMEHIIELMRDQFSKEIVVLEVGWPTNGPRQGDAIPGLVAQRQYLKEASEYLYSEGLFFNVADALDIPSKLHTTEGLVGLHWGILDYTGGQKHIFPLKSLFIFLGNYLGMCLVAFWYNRKLFATYKEALEGKKNTIALCVLLVSATLIAYMLFEFYELYLFVVPFFQALFTILVWFAFFDCYNKFIQFLFADFARRHLLAQKIHDQPVHELEKYFGKVSMLLAGKNEDAHQIIETIEALLNQTYKDIEVLYVDNNSVDSTGFDAVCRHFGAKHKNLKLLYQEKIEGFKAGALNFLLTQISAESEFIAVVDADYVVKEQWIETALRYVRDDTGFVQCPQSYRFDDAQGNTIEVGSAVEQNFVFDTVYPVRALLGDIVQNGTMVVIKKKYLKSGWPTYSICEDAALGFHISHEGGTSHYVPEVLGKGTAPKNFKSLKKQRHRWVFGSMQILRHVVCNLGQIKFRTLILYFCDWLCWIIQGIYPLLLLSSIGFAVSLWLVYWYLQISWVMIIGFAFVSISLALFIATYIRTYKTHRYMGKEIISLLAIEFALVNTISKAVLSGLLFRKYEFAITRQRNEVRAKDIITLIVSFGVLSIGILLILVVFLLKIPLGTKFLGLAQLIVVLLPQMAYMRLLSRY